MNAVGVGLGIGTYFSYPPFSISCFSTFLELDFFLLNYLGVYIRGFDLSPVLNFEAQILFAEGKNKLFAGGGVRVGLLEFLNILFVVNYNILEVLGVKASKVSNTLDQKLQFKIDVGANFRF